MKKKITKRPNKRRAQSKLGSALSSTAAFAAGVVRETEELVRNVASSVTKSTEVGPSPGATELLVHQHRAVEGLFDRLESSKKGFDKTLRELADDLTAHISTEEELFYPAVRKANPDLILEGLEEHAMGRFALGRILATKASDKSLKARLKALKELMTNHHHEEEHDLFPKVRRLMSDAALKKLGAKMLALFNANVERGHEAVLATFDDALRKPVRASPKRASPKRASPKRASPKRASPKRT
ncbi:MAG: hemerythrin domain-containing protein [Polyangiaceae bacterium]